MQQNTKLDKSNESKYTFQTLYDTNVNGKIKQWSIIVKNHDSYSTISCSYGYTDGKQIETTQTIKTGKNIGKSNETTHYEQAILEATSKWKHKNDQGYKPNIPEKSNLQNNINDLIDKTTDLNINDNNFTFPMLAQDYHKHKSKLVYPVFIQPKLDGYRMIYNSKKKSCNSRQGKEFTIIKQTELFKELTSLPNNIILDGELYIHNGTFEHLGILRKKKLQGDDFKKINEIEYHVYDIVDQNNVFKTRIDTLIKLINDNNFKKIKLVSTLQANSENELKTFHTTFLNNNYEGSIVRNQNGKYKCKARSTDLLKFKEFEDAEFTICDFTFEKDTSKNDENLIVWICKTENGDTFNIRPKGTREERQDLYKRGNQFIGRRLHVKYFELTESNIPRFPTTKSESYTSYIRDIVE